MKSTFAQSLAATSLTCAISLYILAAARAQTNQPSSFQFDNFANVLTLQLNGAASRAVTGDGPVLQLTSPGPVESGSAFSAQPVSLTGSAGFATFFLFRLANPGAGLNDLAFTLQGSSASATAGAGGISNSLSVEFDASSTGGNHVVIKTNGIATGATAPTGSSLDNDALWYAWVDYEGVSQDLEVRLSQTPVRPLSPTLDTTVNLPAIIGTNFASKAQGNIVYAVNLSVGGGEVVGTITTDGTIGILGAADILAWNLTVTGLGGASVNLASSEGLSGVEVGNNTDVFNPSAGTPDLTADASHLYFNFSGTDGGYLGFQMLPFYGGEQYWSCGANNNSDTAQGFGLVPVLYTDPSSIYVSEAGNQIIATAATAPSYVNVFAGFTGTGGIQQDVVAWKFTGLPNTRVTGTLSLTNLPSGFQMTNGMVLMQYLYDLDGITITQYLWVPIVVSQAGPSAVNFQSAPVDAPDADGGTVSGPYQPDNEWTLCSAYTDSTSPDEGVVLSTYDNGGEYPNSLDDYFDTVLPSDIDEPTFTGLLGVQSTSNLPPDLVQGGIIGKLTSTNNIQVFFPRNQAGVFTGWTTLYSQGVFAGTMSASQQILARPPATPVLATPRLSGTNFLFDFATVQSQSFTVWVNSNLGGPNWSSYTNLTGDGYVHEISVPTTSQQNYFRLTSP